MTDVKKENRSGSEESVEYPEPKDDVSLRDALP